MEFLFRNAKILTTRGHRYLEGECEWQGEQVTAYANMSSGYFEAKLQPGDVRIEGTVEDFADGAGLLLSNCKVIDQSNENHRLPSRVLEPEVMDSDDDAREYDTMDHSGVNACFVSDLLFILKQQSNSPTSDALLATKSLRVLDLGAGTAQIPIELARRDAAVHVTAVDAAESMLAIARTNVAAANLTNQVELILADAKNPPFADGSFSVVISNSIVHHIADPRAVLAEAIRVTAAGGQLFHRDLVRPFDEGELQHLVNNYARGATTYQRKLFADSLRAALTIEEMRDLVGSFGFASTVYTSSDRHWTWMATKP